MTTVECLICVVTSDDGRITPFLSATLEDECPPCAVETVVIDQEGNSNYEKVKNDKDDDDWEEIYRQRQTAQAHQLLAMTPRSPIQIPEIFRAEEGSDLDLETDSDDGDDGWVEGVTDLLRRHGIIDKDGGTSTEESSDDESEHSAGFVDEPRGSEISGREGCGAQSISADCGDDMALENERMQRLTQVAQDAREDVNRRLQESKQTTTLYLIKE